MLAVSTDVRSALIMQMVNHSSEKTKRSENRGKKEEKCFAESLSRFFHFARSRM